MKILAPFIVGLLFGLGLCLGGMSQPQKVLGFLDLAGAWDPSLAFVMGGAVSIAFVAFRVLAGRERSLNGAPLALPQARAIDARLLGGAALFGIGWGLAGFCPGPALVGLGFLSPGALLFVVAMAAGMILVEALSALPAPDAATEDV
ncbi:DUF6691 family protein [Rhodoblastus sp.]|jgi:hypothetical protein|uniref:DUF6691 family protein n=1 Tax=Rhodoblastus sp. TaxID=1962975 RepID=UPI0025D2369B|nr:DUF6691 family protein [Rhodoblastus sp.]